MPNREQIYGLVRIVVTAVCTWLAAKGLSAFGDTGIQGQLAAVAVGIVAVVWSLISHTDAAKLQAAARVDPQIKITVPDRVIRSDSKIGALVANDTVPNVTKAAA